MAQVVEFLKAGTTSWTCPAGVTNVKIECLGAGSDGFAAGYGTNSQGGAGGGYAAYTGTVIPGTVYTVQIPTRLNHISCVFYYASNDYVGATSGVSVSGQLSVAGSRVGNRYDVAFAGGGCPAVTTGNKCGGGGAGGPNGKGATAARWNSLGPNSTYAGIGGCGANGGTSPSSNPSAGISATQGGNNRSGNGGGLGATTAAAAVAGSNGGGGGGGSPEFPDGANGSMEIIWTSTITGEQAGPSSGGGGGCVAQYFNTNSAGGNAGYGGGGGSGVATAGRGGDGLIVLTYTPATTITSIVPKRSTFFIF